MDLVFFSFIRNNSMRFMMAQHCHVTMVCGLNLMCNGSLLELFHLGMKL